MNSKKSVAAPSERFYPDQIKILWERYHGKDVPEDTFSWQSWNQGTETYFKRGDRQ